MIHSSRVRDEDIRAAREIAFFDTDGESVFWPIAGCAYVTASDCVAPSNASVLDVQIVDLDDLRSLIDRVNRVVMNGMESPQ